jgi:3-hydroxyacyl-CoA dehydrogenase
VGRTIQQDRRDGVAILVLAQPPLNTLTHALRGDLAQALEAALADPATDAIVLTGMARAGAALAPRGFSAGLDLREMRSGLAAPSVTDLCALIEDAAKPVVAVLHGQTLGAGAELALAAHARLATGDALIGFPDVLQGLCPGAGGSQRLTRWLGAERALDLLLSQHPRPLRSRLLRPLVDQLVTEDSAAGPDGAEAVLAMAVQMARAMAADAAAGRPFLRGGARDTGLQDFAANAAAIAGRRAEVAQSANIAGAKIVDCVEAACLLPFAAGLAFEAVAFEDLLASDVAQALCHATFAEARAANMPDIDGQRPDPVKLAAVIGGGVAAAQLALGFLLAGLPVIQFERSDEALAAARERITALQAGLTQAGRLSEEVATAQMARWRGTTRLTDLAGADLLIEAVADHFATKQQVMAALDRVAAPGAILVTTSTLHEIDRIAATTTRPGAVFGLFLPPPAHVTRLAEVIPATACDPAVMARLVQVLRQPMTRLVMRGGTGGGALGEVLLAALREAGAGLLRQGVAPGAIDAALQDYGLGQGLFRQMDITGLETCLARGRLAARRAGPGGGTADWTYLADLDRLIMAGRTGQRAGRGFYLWQDGQPRPDRALNAILDLDVAGSDGAKLPAANFPPEAIVLRAVAAMANAGARALRAGMALRPSDIDMAMIQGFGFPRWHGGPMKAADQIGLFEILQALRRLSAEDAQLYTPDPGFAALVREGETFDALNRLGRNRRVIPG